VQRKVWTPTGRANSPERAPVSSEVFPARAAKSALLVRLGRNGLVMLLVSAGALSGSVSGANQKKPRAKPAQPPKVKPKPAEAAAPFRIGETLEYRILWSRFEVNAARLQLSVVERRPFFSGEAWHLQAQAHTVDTTRLVFTLDDQFDSYSSPSDLVSLQYEMYLHEQGKNENNILRMSSGEDPAPSPVPQARVLPGTRDPLSYLAYLRQVDWARTPEIRGPVYDGRRLYEARARLKTPQGTVSVPAGNYNASRIDVQIYERGHTETTARFGVWLASDVARTPVMIEVEVPFGTARVELTRILAGNQ
jgi:hypothetical protein